MSRRILAALFAVVALGWVPTSASAQRQHTVRPGQSLSRIARRYRVDVWDLALANRMRPSGTIRAGQTLSVPPRGVTYVRPGQTLSHIARANHCSVEELMRANRMRRRRLRLGQRLVLPGFVEESDPDRDWGQPEQPGVVHVRRREEVRELRLVDGDGRVTREALEGLGDLMRRHDDDAAEVPHPRLASLLAAISDHFGGREISLISGRREAGGYTRESSRHVRGHATDIRVRGVPRRAVWDYCRTLRHTGCGYYPRSTFVHVDVRDRAGQWVDWSRPGARARYGSLRGPWPRFCSNRRRRSHRRCAREGRSVSNPDAVPTEITLTEEARELMPTIPTFEPEDSDEEEPEETAEGEAPEDERLDS